MKSILLILVFCGLFVSTAFSYNYSVSVELPAGVLKLLPEKPDILSAVSADLNGDKKSDYAVIIQSKPTDSPSKAEEEKSGTEGRRLREFYVITANEAGYEIAAKTKQAVLCSDCGSEGRDSFLEIKALTKTFTILHKFNDSEGGAWGIASKFGYSRRDNKWQLTYFSAAGIELKPDDFGLINLEDFDIDFFMASGQVQARPDSGDKKHIADREILFTENGAAFAVMPDETGLRYLAGDRYYRKIILPCLSADRKQIAFIRNNDMYVMDSDGRNEKKLFRDVLKISRYNYESEGTIYSMDWSPDGRWFALTGLKSNMYYDKGYFYLRGYDGVTKAAKEYGRDDSIKSPCFSPDSSKLAYYRGTTITVMDIKTGTEKELCEVKGRAGITWSKDGNRILTAVEGGYGIIDVNNCNVRVVKCRGSSGGRLYWSDDEKNALYYTSNYIFTTPLNDGADMKTVAGPSYGGLIDGLAW